MIVTNVRMPVHEYRQMKAVAAELGMSFNELITSTMKDAVKEMQTKKVKKLTSVYDAFDALLAKNIPSKPMGWSKEDEAIYSV